VSIVCPKCGVDCQECRRRTKREAMTDKCPVCGVPAWKFMYFKHDYESHPPIHTTVIAWMNADDTVHYCPTYDKEHPKGGERIMRDIPLKAKTTPESFCKKCGVKIHFTELPSGKWRPTDASGSPHTCSAPKDELRELRKLCLVNDAEIKELKKAVRRNTLFRKTLQPRE